MTERLAEAHPVYPGGPPCQPNCPGPWSMYHDGYADGYENALATPPAALDVERLARALRAGPFAGYTDQRMLALAQVIAAAYQQYDPPEREPDPQPYDHGDGTL